MESKQTRIINRLLKIHYVKAILVMMKKTILVLVMAMTVTSVFAQVDDEFIKEREQMMRESEREFEKFSESIKTDFENFRRSVNAEYARFMSETWKEFRTMTAEEPPAEPEPPEPVVADPKEKPTADPIRFEGKPIVPVPIERPKPIEPIKPASNPVEPLYNVAIYGTQFPFHIDETKRLTLSSADEKSVAEFWNQLSNDYYDNLVAECLSHRDDSNLCDWAYLRLTEALSEKCCGGKNNAAVVLQMFILTQSGYQTRIANASGHLVLLMGSEEVIYKYKFFTLENVRFYIIDRSMENETMYIFNRAFPNEKPMSLVLGQPELNVVPTTPRTLQSKRYPNVQVTVCSNKNLLDFYNDYPLSSRWDSYTVASASSILKESLYPTMKKVIEGKSQAEAANIFINFVQTAYEYETDDKQFGYERPLFPDETAFYPYCDCEDRSIFFAMLVRELMGLDVVLLHYPGHLATAVNFTEDVSGDYLIVNGKKYIVCDPTYINANIGCCMPDYKTVSPEVVTIAK